MRASVLSVEPLGPFSLVTLGGVDSGAAGRFHMVRACDSDSVIGRPLSAIGPAEGGARFVLASSGGGLAPLLRVGAQAEVQGPFGRGFDLAAAGRRPLLVGGGFGVALLAGAARELPGATLLAGFRDAGQALAAGLVPAASSEVIVDGDLLGALGRALASATGVLAAGPDGLVRAVAARVSEAGLACQVALEAPMACGYGSCHGCAVRLDGRLQRLCIEGPVVDARRLAAA